MLELTNLFSKMEDILNEEISFQTRWRFTQIRSEDSPITCNETFLQPLSFFDENKKNLDFVQNGEIIDFNNLDTEKTFFAITKFPTTYRIKSFFVYAYQKKS